jgi:hypothetical protein
VIPGRLFLEKLNPIGAAPAELVRMEEKPKVVESVD